MSSPSSPAVPRRLPPSSAVFRRFPLFSAVACRPPSSPAVLHHPYRPLSPPTRICLRSWGLSSSLTTAVLEIQGRGRTAFCRPVQSFSQVARQVGMKDEDGLCFAVPSRPGLLAVPPPGPTGAPDDCEHWLHPNRKASNRILLCPLWASRCIRYTSTEDLITRDVVCMLDLENCNF